MKVRLPFGRSRVMDKGHNVNIRAKLTALLLVLTALAIISCGTTEDAIIPVAPGEPAAALRAEAVFYAFVMYREWVLSEIRTAAQTVTMDQGRIAATGFDALFTIRFEESMVYGRAAPNLFRGPYALLEEEGGINFRPMATTRMATLNLPELTEHEFLGHLRNVAWWSFDGINLQLHVYDKAMTDLVFAPLEARQ